MTAGMRYFGPDTPLFVPYSTREFPSASLLKTPQSKPTMPSASSEAATTPRPKVSIPCRPRFPKRLRSCLSPSRTPSSSSGICTPESRPASRATSFSSEVSLGVGSDGYSVDGPHDGQWKRSKSVRWEGEDEDDGASVVTSYYSTYSASEYDRTPLEPPSQEERNCVLPARGSRCFGTQIDCFNASFALAPPSNAHASTAVAIDAEASGDASVESGSSTSLDMFTTPPIHQAEFSSIDEEEEDASSATSDVEDCDVVKTDEDREWEECMERRRMMFAMRCKETKDEQPECGQPAFEGYRSLGATLAQLLDSIDRHPSIGCDVGPSQSQPDHEAIQRGRSLERLQDVLEDEVEERPAQGYSLSFGRTERIELEDEDDSEAEDEIDAEAQHRRDQFVFTNLHNLRLDTNDLDLQPHTRTCSSSDSSDLSDQILATPQGSSVTSEGDHERAHAFDAGHEGSPLELTTSISTPKAHLATLPEVPEFES